MAIYELTEDQISRLPETTFSEEGVHERLDLQRILRANVECVSPGTLIIAEEFGQWEDSRRRIDLLGLDKDANLVVIELKRSDDGGRMDLQAIRYAAMVSTMTFEQAAAAQAEYLRQTGIEQGAEESILGFLEWDEPDEDQFAQDVRIVLVAADFSKELTSAVIWLNDHGLDIRCVRLKPYTLGGRVLLDVQQVIPLPEAAEFQVQVREKVHRERSSRRDGPDFTRYTAWIGDEVYHNQWKRRAILVVVNALVQRGTAPERISELLRWKRLWITAEGHVKADELASQAAALASAAGRRFERSRWFMEEDEIIHSNGRTYAFTNQWGTRWSEAMNVLAQSFPEHRIRFEPVPD